MMYVYMCGHVEIVNESEAILKSDQIEFLSKEINKSLGLETVEAPLNGKVSHASPYVSTAIEEPPPIVEPERDKTPYLSVDHSMCGYDYQMDGVDFILKTNFTCLIADAMGLGKTIQTLLACKLKKQEVTPTLFILKPTLIFQWCKEYHKWVDPSVFAIMPIVSRAQIIPGMPAYAISMDFLARKGVLESLKPLGIKCIVVDESHSFKDPSSARTIALIKLIQENRIEKRVFLSGTPIKNRADEYFTILNLLAPHIFRDLASFKRNWLIANEKGQYTRIAPWRLEEFKKKIAQWVLRREKHEVKKSLPKLRRDYQFREIDDPRIKESYNRTLGLFQSFMSNTAGINSKDILGWLARLRSITGQAKCQMALDWSQEFLDSTEDPLCIGIHHTAVRDTLYYVFEAAGYRPLKYSGEDSPYTKERTIQKFTSGENRLLILNQVAGGTGLNLQTCSNALVLERQWSSSEEAQFEGRFDRDGQVNDVMITYLMARGTIDEFFHDMVETKRKIFGETISANWDLVSDMHSLKDLAERTIANPLK